MYIAIYVKLVRARKSMKQMQSGARVSKSKSHMKAIKIGAMLIIVAIASFSRYCPFLSPLPLLLATASVSPHPNFAIFRWS